MKLSLKEVEHIAELAKLALTNEEKALFQEQLSSILAYAENLQTINTENISPTATILPQDTVLRHDVVKRGLSRENLLSNASKTDNGMFQVDVILDAE